MLQIEPLIFSAPAHSPEDLSKNTGRDSATFPVNAASQAIPPRQPSGMDRIKEYWKREDIRTREQVEKALRLHEGEVELRLGEILLAGDWISEEQLNKALAMQRVNPKLHLGQILVRMGAIDLQTIRRALACKLGIPVVNLRHFCFEPVNVEPFQREFMLRHQIVPLFRSGMCMVVAVEDPLNLAPLQDLAFFTQLKVDAVMAPRDHLAKAIARGVLDADLRSGGFTLEAGFDDEPAVQRAVVAAPATPPGENEVVQLVNGVILTAFKQGASDIHIEAMRDPATVRVRFRRDGLLRHHRDIPPQYRDALVSRIKIMSKLDISEKRRSQDGKINFAHFGPARIEVRVVTIPTVDSVEDVVMRILTPPTIIDPQQLGLAQDIFVTLQDLIRRPHGLLFVCGPTGSGKTTTLHALLSILNTPDRKILTVEDPIEITQEGLRQVQVQSKLDWTFATVLRSFMRADPDVIMVGETRDLETARTVIEASLTGHLVLSTMHTNSAVESMVRLLDFGLDPFNFADALVGVLGQRLTRRLCAACSRRYEASDEELATLAFEYCQDTELTPDHVVAQWRRQYGDAHHRIVLRAPCGCGACDDSGYKGRLGLHELLVATPGLRRLIAARADTGILTRTAVAQGMRSLRRDGIDKILQGLTDWSQVRTV